MAEAFTTLTAVAAPYDPINVDTDQILPARFLKFSRDGGYGRFLFHDLRFRDDGSEAPSFVLNQPAFRAARIFVANTNFGCGSSREGAAYGFSDYGIRAVIAPSFSDIFFNNCLRNGIVPVRLSEEDCTGIRILLHARPGSEMTVDLRAQTVTDPQGREYAFVIDEFFRQMMLEGEDEIGFTIRLLPDVEAFEATRRERSPWVVPSH